MPRVRLKSRFRKALARAIYETVDELRAEGVARMTVRQLYYQLVIKGVISSGKKAYKNFDSLLVALRRADPKLDAVFYDDTRPVSAFYSESIWRGQRYYVELWSEKATLSQFLQEVASKYKVNVVICRGYPSLTRLVEARKERRIPEGVQYVILYFGDWDPTGEDIFRHINEELKPHGITVEKVALTKEQVEQYRLPTLKVKPKDTRTPKFRRKYKTTECAEIDALRPTMLKEIIREKILSYLDVEGWLKLEVEELVDVEAMILADKVLEPITSALRSRARELIANQVRGHLESRWGELVKNTRKGVMPSISAMYDRNAVLDELRRLAEELGVKHHG